MDYTKEQAQIINFDSGNMIVSASAGSGKTTTMIDRLIKLIIDGKTDISNVLVITFTEASASDMREKLRTGIIKKIKEGENQLTPQLSKIQMADISTIHAFCARLLRKYFYKVGLSNDFIICDEFLSESIKNRAIDYVFKNKGDDENFLSLCDAFSKKRNNNSLKEEILSLYNFAISESNPKEFLNKCLYYYTKNGYAQLKNEYIQSMKNVVKEYIHCLTDLLDSIDKNTYGILYHSTVIVIERLNNILNAKDENEIQNIMSVIARCSADRNLSGKIAEIKEEVQTINDKSKKYINDALALLSSSNEEDNIEADRYSREIINLVLEFKEKYDKEKKDDNLVDFNDLEHFILELLEDNSALETIKNKYKYIFVDEYQDINGVQDKLISLLENNNLFVVGDEKQSIYGFRGSNPDHFVEKINKMKEKNDSVVRLNKNFRSTDGVIDFVNETFNYCMTEEFYGSNYSINSNLISSGLYGEHKGKATLHTLVLDKVKDEDTKTPQIYDILNEYKNIDNEDNYTSALIYKIIESERGKEYYDLKENKVKTIENKDICILSRKLNKAKIEKIIKGLRARGVEIASSNRENILDFKEVQILHSVLKLIYNFSNADSLVIVLKSPIGNFSNEELFDIVNFYKDNDNIKMGWDFVDAFNYCNTNLNNELGDKIRTFKKYFDEIRFLSNFRSAKDILSTIINDSNFYAYLFASGGTYDLSLNRIKTFISLSIVGDKQLSVEEFLHNLEIKELKIDMSNSVSDDAIKFITIHYSKGLEYPVVIVIDGEGWFISNNSIENKKAIYVDRHYGFAIKSYNAKSRTYRESLFRSMLKIKRDISTVKEEMRLTYVALTRAKYNLHVVSTFKDKASKKNIGACNCIYDLIPYSNNIDEKIYSSDDLVRETMKAQTRKVFITGENKTETAKLKNKLSYIYPFMSSTTLPLKKSVTEISSEDYSVNKKDKDIKKIDTKNIVSDSQKGIIAHKIMELYDYNTDANIKDFVNNLVENKIISIEEANAINLDVIARSIKIVKEAVKDKKIYREKSFLLNLDLKEFLDKTLDEKVIVQGIIDMLILDGDTAEIIDYKYSNHNSNELKNRYTTQLKLYAMAVEKGLNKKVTKLQILNLITGEIVKIDR